MNKLKTLFMVALAFTALAYASERVYLAPFSMIGINEDLGITAEKLMHAYIDENGRYILVNYAEDDSVKAGDYESINKVAIEKNCSKFIIAEFTRLGQNTITSFKLYDVNNEKPVWSDRLKAANPDDFDPIIERVARNIGSKRLATDDDDIYTITEQETKKPKKKAVTTYLGFKIVGETAFNHGSTDGGFGIFVFYDAGNVLFGFDYSGKNFKQDDDEVTLLDLRNIDLLLSVYYPFGTKNITPFIGGGMGYSAHANSKNNDEKYRGNGATLMLGGGALFNRSGRISLFAQLHYFINFYDTPFEKIEEDKDSKEQISKITKKQLNGLNYSFGLAFGF